MIKPFEGLKCNYMTGLQFCFKRLCKAHHALKINWGLKVELMGLKTYERLREVGDFYCSDKCP